MLSILTAKKFRRWRLRQFANNWEFVSTSGNFDIKPKKILAEKKNLETRPGNSFCDRALSKLNTNDVHSPKQNGKREKRKSRTRDTRNRLNMIRIMWMQQSRCFSSVCLSPSTHFVCKPKILASYYFANFFFLLISSFISYGDFSISLHFAQAKRSSIVHF